MKLELALSTRGEELIAKMDVAEERDNPMIALADARMAVLERAAEAEDELKGNTKKLALTTRGDELIAKMDVAEERDAPFLAHADARKALLEQAAEERDAPILARADARMAMQEQAAAAEHKINQAAAEKRPAFHAAFMGLADLGRRIQEAAASTTPPELKTLAHEAIEAARARKRQEDYQSRIAAGIEGLNTGFAR